MSIPAILRGSSTKTRGDPVFRLRRLARSRGDLALSKWADPSGASPHVSRAVPDGRGSSCERPTPARFRSSYSARPHDKVVYPRSRVSRRPMQPGNRPTNFLCVATFTQLSKANYAPDGASSQVCEQYLQSVEVFATLLHMDNLYENTHSGSVTCHKHLGCEASAAFQAKPNAKSVKTSFGTIRKMTETERTEWLEMVSSMWASGCESCR